MEKNNIGLIITIIVLSLIIGGLGGFIIYDKVLVNEEKTENKENEPNNNTEVTEDTEKVEIKQATQDLNTSVGQFIVTKSGDVYYRPSDHIDNTVIKLNFTNETVLGTKETYKLNELIDMSGEIIEFEGYKLDLENIQGAYSAYFGNGGLSQSILFISAEGKISELTITALNENAAEVKFTKNIEKYKNIVSVVNTVGDSANYAILIDNEGNKYEYFGAEF